MIRTMNHEQLLIRLRTLSVDLDSMGEVTLRDLREALSEIELLTPEVMIRPNGKAYSPKKGLRQVGYDGPDDEHYVVVMRTWDEDKARAFATPYQMTHLVEPTYVWAKEVRRNGERYIATDADSYGVASIRFRESDDPA